ncbi:MAG: hypothetical protein EOO75_09665, partial [Myxococcales bacterium]
MPTIRLRIGASLDTSLSAVVFQPLVEAARQARAQITRELEGIDAQMAKLGRGRRSRAGAGAGADADPTGTGRGGYRDQGTPTGTSPALDRQRRENKAQESEQDRHDREMRAKQKAAAKAALAEERELAREKERVKAATERSIERVGGSTTRSFGGLVRRGVGVAADIAAGAGVKFDLGGAVQSRFDLEKRATDLSNAAYMQGQSGPAGVRQDPRQLMRDVQGAANATGLDTTQAMEGLQAFVGKTGDLETGRAILFDMARLSRATGADLNDVVSAAGDVSANLGEVGDRFATAEAKANAVKAVMSAIAGQGKVGAVEMKDLASQMAKLAASAPMFQGDVAGNMASMGALAQMARAGGGAASATQAATSVQGFVGTFGKKARRDAFKGAGVKIEDDKGMLLDPEEIIVNSLKATGGKRDQMNKLFMDASAQRTVRGFQNLYVQSGGGAAGEKAVRDRFGQLRKASMGQGEIGDSFDRSMQTSEAQAQKLKNALQQQLGDAVEQVAPKLIALAPAAGDAVQAFGHLVAWAANNPFQGIAAALALSLTKSIAAEGLSMGTSKLLSAAGSRLAPQGFSMGNLDRGSKAATAGATLGAGLAIAAAAVTIASVGMLAIDKVMSEQQRGKAVVAGEGQTGFAATTAFPRCCSDIT